MDESLRTPLLVAEGVGAGECEREGAAVGISVREADEEVRGEAVGDVENDEEGEEYGDMENTLAVCVTEGCTLTLTALVSVEPPIVDSVARAEDVALLRALLDAEAQPEGNGDTCAEPVLELEPLDREEVDCVEYGEVDGCGE